MATCRNSILKVERKRQIVKMFAECGDVMMVGVEAGDEAKEGGLASVWRL